MEPYYQDEACTIYHGNSLELTALPADVLVTDPPYGVELQGKATKHTKRREGGYTMGDDAEVGPLVVADWLTRVVRAGVFPGNRRLFAYPEPADIGCVYCPSGAGIGKWGFTCFHPVLFYGTRPSTLRPTSMQSFETAKPNGHPCPKPIGWMTWLLTLVSLPGETVLDPFMGSGTTLRAAKDTGRQAIGIELEERYCEIAARRLSQEVLVLDAG